MQLNFVKEEIGKAENIVVGVYDKGKLSTQAEKLDAALKGRLKSAIKAAGFTGKFGMTLPVLAAKDDTLVLLMGLGKPEEIGEKQAIQLGGKALVALNHQRAANGAVVLFDAKIKKLKPEEFAASVALGAKLRSWRFDKYRTKEPVEKKPTLKKLAIATADAAKAKKAFEAKDKVGDGVLLTRELVAEPANVIYPVSLAARAKELTKLGVTVEVLGVKEMKKLGMGALLGVGQGSANESQMVIMQWNGGKKGEAPLAFVGKGVTFDTGGISIKPAGGMEDMKWDMGGSGVVIGLMAALAARKAKVNVVCVGGLVENMPSGTAQRPGDVVKSMSGQTIEVINTDAEGRLVLADALWYTQDRFKPQFMVNLATLTGAIIIALGSSRAGLFSNNDQLADRLFKCGQEIDEPLWRLPLGDEYDKQINCDIADMKNVGEGREAGSITAAQFLQRFVNGVPWAHLDIAGVAWSKKDSDVWERGATGFGVRLLERLVSEYYEK